MDPAPKGAIVGVEGSPTPQVFGKYILLERLAAGGMGEVFLAKAGPKGFERYFAIKRILTQHEDAEDFEKMLLNEARISISLVHPNIAQVFEFGHLEGHFFLAMEYIDGLSVSKLLTAGIKANQPVPTADAIFIAMQVCRALDYAHDKTDSLGSPLGIIHRDISPQNVLIDMSGSVKLIDFGIAKAAGTAVQSQTEAGFIKGKIGYMSPEQSKGMPIDRRSDIFALGIVLYEMLAMRRCYLSNNSMEQLRMVQEAEVPRLASLATNQPLPKQLEEALAKALARDPKDRYDRAGEFEQALAHALSEVDRGYTAQGLAKLVKQWDFERESRTNRFKKYADIHAEELLPTRVPGGAGIDPKSAEFDAQIPTIGAEMIDDILPTGVIAADGSGIKSGAQRLAARARRSWPRDGVMVGAILVGVAAGIYLAFGHRDKPELPVAPPPAAVATAPVVAAPAEPTPVAPSKAPAKATKQRKKSGKAGTDGVAGTSTGATASAATPAADEATGCVTIVVDPWANVMLDGKKVGTTPIKCLALKPGKYQLTLVNPATGTSKEVSVKVEANKTAKIIEQL